MAPIKMKFQFKKHLNQGLPLISSL